MKTQCAPVYPFLIAHRGGGAHAPENTLAGLRAAAALAVAGVEFDVMLCADRMPVLMHDETLERTTNGHGRVADTSSAALARLDAGTSFDLRFAGETVPTLMQAIDLCNELGLWANVEIKPAAGFERATGAAVARLCRRFRPGAVLLSSFSAVALGAAREAAPELPRALLLDTIPADWPAHLLDGESCALHVDWRALKRPQVDEVLAAGIPLACYTVNDPVVAAQLRAWGVTALFSDWPDRLGGNVG